MSFPAELRINRADLNANTWTQILLGIGETKNFTVPTSSGPKSVSAHGYGFFDKKNKQYVVSWNKDLEEENPSCKKLSFRTLTENTGKYIKSIRTNQTDAPKVRKVLEYAHKRRSEEIKDQYCLLGRTIYRILSWFANFFFKCIGCGTTEHIMKRHARSLPAAAAPA